MVLLDAGFPAARLTHATRVAGVPVTLVVRLSTRQVFYTTPGKYRGHDRPRLHGERLDVADPNVPSDGEVCYPDDVFGTTQVRVWHRVHPKTPDIGVVEGSVVRVDVDRLRRGMRRSTLVLWVSTSEFNLGLVNVLHLYLRRFDVEHLFRLWKHHLGMVEYHPVTPEQYTRWVQCLTITTVEVYLARDHVTCRLLPWETSRNKLSPLRALRGLSVSACTLWSPPQAPKSVPLHPGRPRGKARKRRQTYPVWRPGAPTGPPVAPEPV